MSVGDQRVEVDRSGPSKFRWTCPRGHVKWDRTNNHVWCHSCRQQAEAGEDVDPEHFEIVDQKTGESIPWSAIEVVGE